MPTDRHHSSERGTNSQTWSQAEVGHNEAKQKPPTSHKLCFKAPSEAHTQAPQAFRTAKPRLSLDSGALTCPHRLLRDPSPAGDAALKRASGPPPLTRDGWGWTSTSGSPRGHPPHPTVSLRTKCPLVSSHSHSPPPRPRPGVLNSTLRHRDTKGDCPQGHRQVAGQNPMHSWAKPGDTATLRPQPEPGALPSQHLQRSH